MKSKRVLMVVACVVLAVALGMVSTACTKKTAEEKKTEPAPVETTTPAGTDVPADAPTDASVVPPADTATGEPAEGVANPVVASTPDEITSMLGIEFIVPDDGTADAKYSIIGDKIAQLEYTMDSGKGPINVTYRAAKTSADESLDVSGDFTQYSYTETVNLDGGQSVTVNTNDGTGAGLCHWFNDKTVSGGISASVMMDPVLEGSQLVEVANLFVSQESKGF